MQKCELCHFGSERHPFLIQPLNGHLFLTCTKMAFRQQIACDSWEKRGILQCGFGVIGTKGAGNEVEASAQGDLWRAGSKGKGS